MSKADPLQCGSWASCGWGPTGTYRDKDAFKPQAVPGTRRPASWPVRPCSALHGPAQPGAWPAVSEGHFLRCGSLLAMTS